MAGVIVGLPSVGYVLWIHLGASISNINSVILAC